MIPLLRRRPSTSCTAMIAHDPKVVQQEEGCEAITDQLYAAVPKNREACPASPDHRISGGGADTSSTTDGQMARCYHHPLSHALSSPHNVGLRAHTAVVVSG